MALYRPTELRQFLEDIGAHPKKGLSQNFLIDGNVIKKIVAAANVAEEDLVLEIGPGPGALTEALSKSGAQIIAVEKDEKLASHLKRLAPHGTTLEVICQDIMDFPIEEKLKGKQKGKVIANLPYHLTTPILTRLLPLNDLLSSITVMVQEEVARRFTASPGTKEYGSITIFLNYYSTPRYNFTVSKKCFYPVPKVESAVITFALHTPPKVSNETLFFKMVRTCFQQRRKMVRTTLGDLFAGDKIESALTKIGCNPLTRPESLSLDQFIQLFELLYS